ncbi:MAG: helix-turn-helix domain-containing protein [Coriobacteriaceae bacterium]
MFSVTVAEASTKLGVSPARVRQLIKSGILAAEQVAGIWLIDEKSVEARRGATPVAVGRAHALASRMRPTICS